MATILIIVDVPSDRNLLAATLRTRGHEVAEASDAQGALAALAQRVPDVVIRISR